MTRKEAEQTLVTVEDRYRELGERIKSRLDSPEFRPLHDLIDEVEKEVREKLVGEGRKNNSDRKARKVLIAAVNSRIDRQQSSSPGNVRPHRMSAFLRDWRNK